MILRSTAIDDGEPARVPSSKYQALNFVDKDHNIIDAIPSVRPSVRVHGIAKLKYSCFSRNLFGNDYFLPVTGLTKFRKFIILILDMYVFESVC